MRSFTKSLLDWDIHFNHRQMPWKNESDPYKIWLSEIIMQQTRVEQGWNYYLKFVKEFPTIFDLANADLSFVLKNWEGLGYYSRARNLHSTAIFIVNEFNGKFPTEYKELLKLKGIGDYTAAAIASFAYNAHHAAIDGNVIRVLSRYFNISTPFDVSEGKQVFKKLAQELLPKQKAGIFNQAIMDFGATVCTPKKPNCKACTLSQKCQAFNYNMQADLPVKSKKIKKRTRYFNFYVFLDNNNHTYIEERKEKDVWLNLNQFPLIEAEKELEDNEIKGCLTSKFNIQPDKIKQVSISENHKQVLSHQIIIAKFVEVGINQDIGNYMKIRLKNLRKFAFPKIITLYLENKQKK